MLVNNAGYGSYGAVEDVPIAEARRQFEVNVFGARPADPARAAAHARRSGSGRIVNISSIGGKIYEPLGGWYHATKFAVEGLSDSLRGSCAPFGIEVVVIEPGAIRTEWGGIAADNLATTSAGTAYADRAVAVTHFLEQADRPSRSSGPDVVARKIAKAAVDATPEGLRYPVGRSAGTIVRARKVLPDRAMDTIIGRMFS